MERAGACTRERGLERATGFEPVTASLEGWNSTTELRPQINKDIHNHNGLKIEALA